MIIKDEKEHRGVGMQNFVYHPDIVEFAHIIQTHSTRAYNAIKEFLPLPSVRSLQYVFDVDCELKCGFKLRHDSHIKPTYMYSAK